MATFYDKLLIAFIITVSLIGYGIIGVYGMGMDKKLINVRQGEKLILQVVNGINSDRIYKFKFEGGEGAIEVKANKVRMLPMDKKICPRSVCSQTGWIEKGYQTIVCLPNRLTVNFESEKNEAVDVMAF
ncbi:MAG: hypothetical protein JG777_2492 [Clostridia bacterium]|jgi:hypothetical protein|nr:hypothetical protein [Clostridia bacterium]